FDAWFTKATAVKPEDRFERASEAAAALAVALRVPLPAHDRGAAQRPPADPGARPRMVAAAAPVRQTQHSTETAALSGGTSKGVARESPPSTTAPGHPRVGRWIALGAALTLLGLLAFALLSSRGEGRPAEAPAPPMTQDGGAAEAGR